MLKNSYFLQTFGFKSLASRLGLGMFKSRSHFDVFAQSLGLVTLMPHESWSRNVNVSSRSRIFWGDSRSGFTPANR